MQQVTTPYAGHVVEVTFRSHHNAYARGGLAMFAYGDVRAMFLGLKFHLKAILGV